jgi:hypothetical protein
MTDAKLTSLIKKTRWESKKLFVSETGSYWAYYLRVKNAYFALTVVGFEKDTVRSITVQSAELTAPEDIRSQSRRFLKEAIARYGTPDSIGLQPSELTDSLLNTLEALPWHDKESRSANKRLIARWSPRSGETIQLRVVKTNDRLRKKETFTVSMVIGFNLPDA